MKTQLFNIFAALGVNLKAIFNTSPKMDNPVPIEERPEDQQQTSDTGIVILKDFLTKNKWSRCGKLRSGKPKGIEIHWVANPKTSAKGNRNWFESRKGGKLGFGSTHFIIDLDGDKIQMIPEREIAFSSGSRTYKDRKWKLGKRAPYWYTLSIECTHTNWAGKMTTLTYDGLVEQVVYLCTKYSLSAKDLYLHYHLTGKNCHRWFVDYPKEWSKFLDIIDSKLAGISGNEVAA